MFARFPRAHRTNRPPQGDNLLSNLVEIDVSGHRGIVEKDLFEMPETLQVLKCNNCGLQEFNKVLAKLLYHKDMELYGNNVTGLDWCV